MPTVTVKAKKEIEHAPEVAVLHLRVSAKAATKSEVLETITASFSKAREVVEENKDDNLEWFSETVYTSPVYPQNDYNLEPEYFAGYQSLTIKLNTFNGEPISWLDDLIMLANVSIYHVSWELTDETAETLRFGLLEEVVVEATRKAEAYARGVKGTIFGVEEIADVGLLSGGNGGASMNSYGAAGAIRRSVGSAGGHSIELKPESITLVAEVEARYKLRPAAWPTVDSI